MKKNNSDEEKVKAPFFPVQMSHEDRVKFVVKQAVKMVVALAVLALAIFYVFFR